MERGFGLATGGSTTEFDLCEGYVNAGCVSYEQVEQFKKAWSVCRSGRSSRRSELVEACNSAVGQFTHPPPAEGLARGSALGF